MCSSNMLQHLNLTDFSGVSDAFIEEYLANKPHLNSINVSGKHSIQRTGRYEVPRAGGGAVTVDVEEPGR